MKIIGETNSSAEIDVLGIGNAIVDVLSQEEEDFLERFSIPKGGMRLINQEDAKSLYENLGPAVEISGGSAANTIAGVASFGGNPAFIGKVCDDQLGEVFSHDIRSQGVLFKTTPISNEPSTARCLIVITPDGERSMSTFLGASVELSPNDIDTNLVKNAKITYLEGYLWDPDAAKQAFLKAAKASREAGQMVALSLSDPFCVDRHREEFKRLIADDIDILFANEMEITSLYQGASFAEAVSVAKNNNILAILTRGESGCVIVNEGRAIEVPANKIDAVVDTTGAGDLFAAGFLYGFLNGHDIYDCGKLGNTAAAEVISHVGARPQVNLRSLINVTMKN